MTLVLISVSSLNSKWVVWWFNRDDVVAHRRGSATSFSRGSAVSFCRGNADIGRDEVVGCWSNQDEVAEVAIVDLRLLLGSDHSWLRR